MHVKGFQTLRHQLPTKKNKRLHSRMDSGKRTVAKKAERLTLAFSASKSPLLIAPLEYNASISRSMCSRCSSSEDPEFPTAAATCLRLSQPTSRQPATLPPCLPPSLPASFPPPKTGAIRRPLRWRRFAVYCQGIANRSTILINVHRHQPRTMVSSTVSKAPSRFGGSSTAGDATTRFEATSAGGAPEALRMMRRSMSTVYSSTWSVEGCETEMAAGEALFGECWEGCRCRHQC